MSTTPPLSPAQEARERRRAQLLHAGRAFGDGLAAMGWGKFFLLSVLFLILASVAFSLWPGGVHHHKGAEHPQVTLDVRVLPLEDGGMLVQPAGKAPRPPAAPLVKIDDHGVRLLAEDAGGRSSVVIDDRGVRIERGLAGAESVPAPGPGEASATVPGLLLAPPLGQWGPAVRLAPGSAGDAPRAAAAVGAAREALVDVLREPLDDKVGELDLGRSEERENWFEVLAVLIILALIMLKIVLGSRNRAESRARQASEMAAEEGLRRQLAEAQLMAMQAQVEPHFLFNTLASVEFLIETDPPRAAHMQRNLIAYLRAALPQMRAASSRLGRELDQCRAYLEILKVRMDERLEYSIEAPAGLHSADFPPLMLQSLVENAVRHGLEPKPEGGRLDIRASIEDGRLQVVVSDTGNGLQSAGQGGTGLGLANLRARLAALYGPAGELILAARPGGGVLASVRVPYRTGDAGAPAAA
jgi:signal transduction histidine kinase